MKKFGYVIVLILVGLVMFATNTVAIGCGKRKHAQNSSEIKEVKARAESAFEELEQEVKEMEAERGIGRGLIVSQISCTELQKSQDSQDRRGNSSVMERYWILVNGYNARDVREKAEFSFQEMELVSEMEAELYGLFLARRYAAMKGVLSSWIELQILILRKEGIVLRGDGEIGRYQIGRWNIRFFGERRVLHAKLLTVGTREDFRSEVEGMTFSFTR